MNDKVLAAVTLVLLGVTDLLNTITILDRGGVELNPIMNYYLSIGMEAFILIKLVLTLGCTYIIYKYSNTFVLLTLNIIYFNLVIYQFILIL